MKILRIVFLSLVAVGVAGFAVFRNVEARRDRRVFAVGLVCQGDLSNGQKEILEAYSSVLQEEGVPYRVLTMTPLLLENPEKIISWRPVLIFPDQLALQANDDMGFWLERYVRAGGTALVVFDAGTKDKESGAFRERAVFQETVGLHYSLYNEMGEKTYARGYLRFQSKEEADFFQIPQGKIFEGNLLGGYAYGSLEYTMARTRPVTGAAPRVFAELVTKENERCPALTLAKLGKGNAFYAGLPLGQLKGFSDDLPLRAVLRTVLFQVAGVPHLLSVPEGKGGLVINWHIDSNAEWASLPWMVKQGYFRQSIPCSLHVTAGDFRDAPGDRLGFDAAGVGRPALEKVRRFGVLGSHGGWGHNWFSDNLNRGMLDAPAIEENVLRNNRALEGISGVPVREYSAPNGVHPQPLMTQILEKLGINSYYYTGDGGSAPNRTFINGRRVSASVWAFPVMPFQHSASLAEMAKARIPEREIAEWLSSVVDYVVAHRTSRLIYSHPYDVKNYPLAVKSFLDHAVKEQDAGRLLIRPMSYFSDFFSRFVETRFQFTRTPGGWRFQADNDRGLEGIVLSLPKTKYRVKSGDPAEVWDEGDRWFVRLAPRTPEKPVRSVGIEIEALP